MREKLAELLELNNLYPSQLAQKAGISTSTVDDILKGKTNEMNIGVNKMLKISSVLGVTVEYLYGKEVQQDPQEQILLANFRALNSEGREKLLDYSDDLIQSQKYKKYSSTGMVQDA